MPRRIVLLIAAAACSAPPSPQPDVPNLPTADDVRFAALAPVQHNGQWHAIPVACVTQQGDVLANDTCAARLVGHRATLPAATGTLGSVVAIGCAPTAREAQGLPLNAPNPTEPRGAWGFLGNGIPHNWHIASYFPDPSLADAVGQAVAGSGWSLPPTESNPVVVERMNLDGTRVIEATAGAQSALFLAGSDLVPLPTDGLTLSGTVTTPGAMPIRDNGHLLVLTSSDGGTRGVHALHLSPDGPIAIGDWRCPQ